MSFPLANLSLSIPAMTATAILAAGVVDDLRSQKFHNWLFIVSVAAAALSVLIIGGGQALPIALLGLLAGVAIFLPLVLMKIIGAGDLKLMAAFGLAAGWDSVMHVSLYGLLWGALFGVLATVLRGQGRVLVHNMVSIVMIRERKGLSLHKIPFTVAILMGWLTVLTLRGAA